MDLLRAQGYIKEAFENAGLTLEYELTEKRLNAKASLKKDNIGDFLFVVAVYPGKLNTASCSMCFNEIASTPNVNQLLNDFNKNAYLLHACEDELLILEHTDCRIKEEEIVQYALDILEELNDEEVLSLLMPLIKETF
ncbi:MAG: hypothetical protein J6A53_09045 [Clostridia bacterium]|nr:hypothetical protein [Clostridia bacterium]